MSGPAATVTTAWTSILTGVRRERALVAALHVAELLRDPEAVTAAVGLAASESRHPRAVSWDPVSVAQGDAGLALVCAQLDRCFPGESWDRVAHRYLLSALASSEGSRPRPSALAGLAGLGFVAMTLGRGGTRYVRLQDTLENQLAVETHLLAEAVLSDRDGMAVHEFDVISGLAGIGAYLLAHRRSPAMGSALKHLLEALVATVTEAGESGLPRWWTPPDLLPDSDTLAEHPHGALNCGLAHGIPGPVSLLALAMLEGAPIAGLARAVEAGSAWLVQHRCANPWGPGWPTMIGVGQSPTAAAMSRDAWCYGAPGVARSLWLAGLALEDETLRALALTAIRAVFRRPVSVRRIDSPTLCHGVGGLLMVTLRFWHDHPTPELAEEANRLVDQILADYEPEDSVLGFRNLEPGGHRIDHAGLLDGAPGVALALLAAATDEEPVWDRLFLLA